MSNEYYLETSKAIEVIDFWLSKGERCGWQHSPDTVKQKLNEHSKESKIGYQTAIEIIEEAKSCKMIYSSAAGIEFIKEQWKKMKVRI